MGSVMSLGIGEGVGIYQAWHYGRRDQHWAERNYKMDAQSMRIDLLGTVREEIRDQLELIVSSLDNMMVVATLMLSIGFAFAAELAAPPSSHVDDSPLEHALHVAYAVLCALSLVLPFWCLIFTLRIRYEVDRVTKDHVAELQDQLIAVLEQKDIVRNTPQRSLRRGGRMGRARSTVSGYGAKVKDVAASFRKSMGPLQLPPEIDVNDVILWAKEDLLHKIASYSFYYPIAQSCLWLSMISVVLTCSVLHGLHLRELYIHDPLVWMSYSSIVTVSAFSSIVFMMHMHWTGELRAHDPRKRRTRLGTSECLEIERSSMSPMHRTCSVPTYGSTDADEVSDIHSDTPAFGPVRTCRF